MKTAKNNMKDDRKKGDASKTGMKHFAPGESQKRKKQQEKGTLQEGLGKDFLNDPGDPESAQNSLI